MAQVQFSLIKKIKIERPEHSLNPPFHPLRPVTSHFCLIPQPLPLKVDAICVSPLTNLYVSKASYLDCISEVVLKKCEPELSYILAKLFNKCLTEFCFPDCWKVSPVVRVFKNVGKRSMAENYCPVSLLSVISNIFEKLLNNRHVDHFEKCVLLSDFQYFWSSRSTGDLLAVVSDRIPRAFSRSGVTQAVALNTSKSFDRIWRASLLYKFMFYRVSGQLFGLISSFLSNRRLREVLDGRSLQEYPVNDGVLQGSTPWPTLLLVLVLPCYTSRTFLMMLSVILLSMPMILLSTLSVIRHLIYDNN